MNDKTRNQIARKLRKVRLELGLTQTEVGEKAGITPNYYARVERAEVAPSVETLEGITRALGVKSSDILPF